MKRTAATRREVLKAGALGALGIIAAGSETKPAGADSGSATAPGFGQACSVVVVRLGGGLSHLDSFDPKPEAPREVRGPFGAVETRVPGMRFSDRLPRLASIADRLAVVRTLTHGEMEHGSAREQLRLPFRDWPGDTGSVPPDLLSPGLLEASAAGGWTYVDREGWDHHASLGEVLGGPGGLPRLDQELSDLILGLERQEQLERTLVVLLTEFGRAPRLNLDGGRDHWPACFSVVLAGGGIRGGTVVGASDGEGAYPVERPVRPGQLAATVCHLAGIPLPSDEPLLHELL